MFVTFLGANGEFAINTDSIVEVRPGNGSYCHILTTENDLHRVKSPFHATVAYLNSYLAKET